MNAQPIPDSLRPPRAFHREVDATLAALRRELGALERASARDWTRAAVKRSFDVAVASTILCLAAPLFAIVAVFIKRDSPGPVFYRARRVGLHGRPLYVLKFRKMREDVAGPALTTDDDERFTSIGARLAKWKLDELPQLWNVLRGDMSLIGPRPEDPCFVALHVDEFRDVLRVRPGMTGLSQIAFAEESRILDDLDPTGHYLERILPQKLGLDRLYVTQYHLRIDLLILTWTLVAVLMRRDVAVHRETGSMNLRRRRPVAAGHPVRHLPAAPDIGPEATAAASAEAPSAEALLTQRD